jgi:hypothetical protein
MLAGAPAGELVVELEDRLRLLERPVHATAENGRDGMQAVLERPTA